MQNLVGKAAFGFELPNINGQLRESDDFAGRWLLLVFHRHLG